MSKTDYAGHVYGQVTVLRELGPGAWWGRCVCGNEKAFRVANLVSGNTQSCGCRKIRHGHARTAEYHVWTQMIRRCHNPLDGAYVRYGKKGVQVCTAWRASFLVFIQDMGWRPAGPATKYTLERKDNARGYEPGNVVWAPVEVQAYNRSTTVWVELDGQRLTTKQAAALSPGVSGHTIARRLRMGWSPRRAVFEPA